MVIALIFVFANAIQTKWGQKRMNPAMKKYNDAQEFKANESSVDAIILV